MFLFTVLRASFFLIYTSILIYPSTGQSGITESRICKINTKCGLCLQNPGCVWCADSVRISVILFLFDEHF